MLETERFINSLETKKALIAQECQRIVNTED